MENFLLDNKRKIMKAHNMLLERSHFVCFCSLRFAKNKQNARWQVAFSYLQYARTVQNIALYEFHFDCKYLVSSKSVLKYTFF